MDGAGSEGRDPLTDLKSLLHEVAQFDLAMAGGDGADAGGSTSDSLRTLLSKPAIIFSNKADIEESKWGQNFPFPTAFIWSQLIITLLSY